MSQSNRYERRRLKKKERDEKRARRAIEFPKKIRRNKTMNRHHLTNKCMGGTMSMHNILWIYIGKHKTWHELFHNLNLDEVIELLIRVKRAKENQEFDHSR